MVVKRTKSGRVRTAWGWPRKLAAGLATAAVCLAVIEGLLRLFLGAPPHPIMVRSMLGAYDRYFESGSGYAYTAYQSAEPDGPCPPFLHTTDLPRVAILGASSLRTGIDVALEDRFSERITARSGVKTLNLGACGADSHDLVGILGETLQWPMSAVVLYTGHCDVGNAFLLQRYSTPFGRAMARILPLLDHSQLFVQYRRLLSGLSRQRLPGEDHEGLGPAEIAMIEAGFERNVRRMSALCRAADVPLVLVVPACDLTYPPPEGVSEPGTRAFEAWQEGMALLDSDPGAAVALLEAARDGSARPVRASGNLEEVLREIASDEGVTLVDARRDLPTHRSGVIPDPALFVDELHFSAAGHEALTDLLLPALYEHLPAPPKQPLPAASVDGGVE